MFEFKVIENLKPNKGLTDILKNFEYTVKFITEALEEKEREEFSRLKVIKANKEKQRMKEVA